MRTLLPLAALTIAAFAQEPERIGPGITPPKVTVRPEPKYSQPGLDAQVQGAVILSLTVGADGLPHDIQIISPLGFGLDEAAVRSVEQWRFSPALKAGAAVPVSATIEVNFRLLGVSYDERAERQRTKYNVAINSLAGPGSTETVKAAAYESLAKLAKDKFMPAMVLYAELLLDGAIKEPDAEAKAAQLMQSALKKKNGGALYWKAKQLLDADANSKEAIALMQDAALRGSAKAQLHLAAAYESGLHGFDKNPAQSKHYLRLCAANGVAACQWSLARMLASEAPGPTSSKHLEAIAWASLAKFQIPSAAGWTATETGKLDPRNRAYVEQLAKQLVR